MQESSISTVRIERTAHPVPSGGVFGRSERLCGQGQDRTVDLPLFRTIPGGRSAQIGEFCALDKIIYPISLASGLALSD
jgi:hypothetical protein